MRKPLIVPLAIGVAFLVLTVAGCRAEATKGPGTPPARRPRTRKSRIRQMPMRSVLWPAPPDPLEQTVAAGLELEPKEFLTNHVHAHLDVFLNGEPIAVPAGIGIARGDPGDGGFLERIGGDSPLLGLFEPRTRLKTGPESIRTDLRGASPGFANTCS